MKVIGKLRIDGNDNAFMMDDSGTTYPIFTGSLHTPEIFNQLITSGYKLCGLPYDFRKDGVSILTLPERDYAPTEAELQDMFDINSLEVLDSDTLRSYISEESITYLQEPPAHYTISTREEFIKYLNDCQSLRNDDDFKPINYFVHPSARFTIDEWKSGEYAEHFRTMEARRTMNFYKFKRLRDWLIDIGMSSNGDAIDIIDTYYMWGLDGINARYVSKQRKTMIVYDDFAMQPGMEADAYEITRQEDALVDRYGAIFPPEDIAPGYNGWVVNYRNGKESGLFKNKIASLKDGEYAVVPIKTKSEEDVLIYSTLKDTITVTPYVITCGSARTFNFVVRMPDITASIIPYHWWSARYDERVNTMAYLRAMAYDMLVQRRWTSDVSTYKALLEAGCDVKGALMYMIERTVDNKTAMLAPDEIDDTIKEFPTEEEVDLYLSGDMEEDAFSELRQIRMDTIKDMVNGVLNLDGVANGSTSDSNINVDEIYKYLYCAHFCRTHVKTDYMYSLLHDVGAHVVEHVNVQGTSGMVVPLMADGFTINVPCPELRAKIDGYKSDLKRYKVQQSDQCCGFLRVIQIAKEYGAPECKRHVAFEAETVNLYNDNGAARKNLDRLMDIFESQLTENVPLSRQNTLRLYKRSTCMREYFRIADEGVMKFTKEMGGQTVPISDDLSMSILSTINKKITSTATYCQKMYADGYMTHYCVNADITPWCIFPKKGVNIPAAALPALWFDWASQGSPQIALNLMSNGYMYKGFVAWTRRYMQQCYFSFDSIPRELNLANYMHYCGDFREATQPTEEYTHSPHIETLLYGIFPSETVREDSGVELRAKDVIPPLTVSKGEIITADTYPEHGKLSIEHGYKYEALKIFTGFEADDFDMLPSVLEVKFPSMSEKYISVEDGHICTDTQENMPPYAISQLCDMGYPVINLWGRKYIFRDLFGILWEVIA